MSNQTQLFSQNRKASSTFNNVGPVNKAEYVGDVTNNINYYVATAPVVGQVKESQKKILFSAIPEPHGPFIGRVDYVNMAITYLSNPVMVGGQIQFPCLVIHALGGYGKTETARKIVSLCREERKFQHFIWIDAEDDIIIKKCFVAVMQQIEVASLHESFQSSNFESLLHQFYYLLACHNNEKFLIVFDNVEDFDKITKYLPSSYHTSNIAVLMTSQHPFTKQNSVNVKNQQLDLMLAEEAMELVENILGSSSKDSASEKKLLVRESGRIALVLHVMASTIKFQRKYKSDYSINDYLREINYEPIQYTDDDNFLRLPYKKSLQANVQLVVDKINSVGGPLGQIAVKIFDRLAYCSSTILVCDNVVKCCFRDIQEEANSVDMKLPVKPVDDLQILRMAIEKLSEFSLLQFTVDQITVHRWIQESRRLSLKDSGDEKIVLRKFLLSVPRNDNFSFFHRLLIDYNSIHCVGHNVKNYYNYFNYYNFYSNMWRNVVDYADLVREFFGERKTLLEFPFCDYVVAEKITRALTENGDVEQFENYSEEVHKVIKSLFRNSQISTIEHIANAFNYDVKNNSEELFSQAIRCVDLNIIKWLIHEKGCIPMKDQLHQCFTSKLITVHLPEYLKELRELKELKELKPFNIDLCESIANNAEKNVLECFLFDALDKLESFCMPWASRRIKITEINSILSVLARNWSEDVLSAIIEENPESLLELLFDYATRLPFGTTPFSEISRIISVIFSARDKLKSVNIGMEKITKEKPQENRLVGLFRTKLEYRSACVRWTLIYITMFEIIRVIKSAFEKLEPSTELTETMEKYSEKNLLECLYTCGSPHFKKVYSSLNFSTVDDWNYVHHPRNPMGMTPLMCAVQHGAYKLTKILLEEYSAKFNVNATDNDQCTALKYAIEYNHKSIVEILLIHGANVFWRTGPGMCIYAIHEAVKSYRNNDSYDLELIFEAFLRSKDCGVDSTDHDGNNILHLLVLHYYATRYKPNHHMLQLLLPVNETLVKMKNNDGLTPQQLAETIIAKFTNGHWHVRNLRSFISELDRIDKLHEEESP